MRLTKDNDLVAFEDGLIQAKELRVESNKRVEEDSAVKRQRYNTMSEIIN